MATSEEIFYSSVRQPAYDGAATNYRLDQRGLIAGDSDLLAARELKLLWQRSHHAVRNNGWAKVAKRKYLINLGVISVKWKNKKMQKLWEEFAANPSVDGYGNLANLQINWNSSHWEEGEALARMVIKRRPGITIPLAIKNIPAEYLDPTYTGEQNSNTRNGITFDADGKPVIYNFSKKLPKFQSNFDLFSIEKVKVSADEVIHIFTRQRAEQWRGIPELAAILLPLYELDDLTDATIAKQKNAQAIAWIIENTNPSAAMSLGYSGVPEGEINGDIDKATGKPRVVQQTSGGGVQYLNKGEKLQGVQGTGIGTELIDLIKFELHKIAQASGINYETLTGDLSGISLSALQYVVQELKVSAEFISNYYVINLGLRPLCYKFRELVGIYVGSSYLKEEPVFQLPRKYGMNELKDAQADVLEITSNIGTLTRALEERNLTPEELEEDIALRKKLGVWVDPNPKTNQQAGNVQPNSNSKAE